MQLLCHPIYIIIWLIVALTHKNLHFTTAYITDRLFTRSKQFYTSTNKSSSNTTSCSISTLLLSLLSTLNNTKEGNITNLNIHYYKFYHYVFSFMYVSCPLAQYGNANYGGFSHGMHGTSIKIPMDDKANRLNRWTKYFHWKHNLEWPPTVDSLGLHWISSTDFEWAL